MPGRLTWPADRLGEGIEAVARLNRWAVAVAPVEPTSVEATAAGLGLDAEPVAIPFAEVGRAVVGLGPAVVRVAGTSSFVLLLRGGRVLAPDLSIVPVEPGALKAALCGEAETPAAGEVDRLLDRAGVRGRRRATARDHLLGQYLAATPVEGCWLLRPANAAGERGVWPAVAGVVVLQTAAEGLWVAAIGLLGWVTLAGRLNAGWLLAWGLLLSASVPCRLAASAAAGRLTVRAGAAVQRRLMAGALRLTPDEVRRRGVGDLLGRVLEADRLPAAALAGGLLGVAAAAELLLAGLALAASGGWPLVAALAAALTVTGWLGRIVLRRRRRWTDDRLALTDLLVERMTGHRTRLAQLPRPRWHDDEDPALDRTTTQAAAMDRAAVALRVAVPNGWCLAGLGCLAPAFVAGGVSAASLAIGVGGVLLARQALRKLAEGIDRLAEAAVARDRLRVFEVAGGPVPGKNSTPDRSIPTDGRVLLDARGVEYRYRPADEPVLRRLTLGVRAGDRVVLEGPSGGGKSTLAKLLAGDRGPTAGLLLLDGLDRATLGDGWRRRVVLAPQFHDNHVLMGTFAFNVLLGRCWPPRADDLAEADRVCRALGLGPLLDRMPAALHQMVGETGWQLSHGERSRLYIARALLQKADIVVLDESFGTLDPATQLQALTFVTDEAPTLVVIAHP